MQVTVCQQKIVWSALLEDKTLIEVEEKKKPKQLIFDPRDLSIKLGIKGKTSWVGSKCHVVETAERGKVNFITGMIYQKANESSRLSKRDHR